MLAGVGGGAQREFARAERLAISVISFCQTAAEKVIAKRRKERGKSGKE
jgi:hypothetical protein